MSVFYCYVCLIVGLIQMPRMLIIAKCLPRCMRSGRHGETKGVQQISKVYNHKHSIFHLNISDLAEHFFSRLLWQRASLNGYSAAAAQNGSVPAVLAGQPAHHNFQPPPVLVGC